MKARSRTLSEVIMFKPATYTIFDSCATAKDVIDLHGEGKFLYGKTAIVTGGSNDVGLETVKALAFAGCRVIMASKSIDMAEKALAEEIQKPGQSKYAVEDISTIIVKHLDLSDLLSIKIFAEDIIEQNERIDFLILSENVMASRVKKYTSAGFEKQMGINHFGHAYLTSLLRSKLESQPFRSRVIVLTSAAYNMGNIALSDLHYRKKRSYSPWKAYANSKLANILFAKRLSEELRGSLSTAVSVHPGLIGYNISKEITSKKFLSRFLFNTRKTAAQAATTVVWACLDSVIDNDDSRGEYFADCSQKPTSPMCNNRTLIDGLWDETFSQLEAATKNLEIDMRIQGSLSISNHMVRHNSIFSEDFDPIHHTLSSSLSEVSSDYDQQSVSESQYGAMSDISFRSFSLGLEDCYSENETYGLYSPRFIDEVIKEEDEDDEVSVSGEISIATSKDYIDSISVCGSVQEKVMMLKTHVVEKPQFYHETTPLSIEVPAIEEINVDCDVKSNTGTDDESRGATPYKSSFVNIESVFEREAIPESDRVEDCKNDITAAAEGEHVEEKLPVRGLVKKELKSGGYVWVLA